MPRTRLPPRHRPHPTPPLEKNKPSPLFALPPETRNQIFHEILNQHHDQSTNFSLLTDLSDPKVLRASPQQPPLARTCRQLRHEVLSLFYGGRTFSIDREMGMQGLLGTWTRVMRPALWYLRSVRFSVFSEFTAVARELEGGVCDAVSVHAWLEEGGSIGCAVESEGETCGCKFARCARDVERGVLGEAEDAPLVRFLKAWDLPAPPVRGDRYLVCSGCGGGNVQVSLRDIRRRMSLPVMV